jgi:hypothetical protein
MRVPLVVPSIRSRKVARIQRSGIRHREHAFQSLDFGNGVIGVHASYIIQYEVGKRQMKGVSILLSGYVPASKART